MTYAERFRLQRRRLRVLQRKQGISDKQLGMTVGNDGTENVLGPPRDGRRIPAGTAIAPSYLSVGGMHHVQPHIQTARSQCADWSSWVVVSLPASGAEQTGIGARFGNRPRNAPPQKDTRNTRLTTDEIKQRLNIRRLCPGHRPDSTILRSAVGGRGWGEHDPSQCLGEIRQ